MKEIFEVRETFEVSSWFSTVNLYVGAVIIREKGEELLEDVQVKEFHQES